MLLPCRLGDRRAFCHKVALGFVLCIWVIAGLTTATAGPRDPYGLKAEPVADGVYVFWGRQEPFSYKNGGNIVNTGFIVGDDDVLVIDTGPVRAYAEEMIRAIKRVTDKPIRHVIVTHHHPDHSFGMQVFKKAGAATVLMHANAYPLLKRDRVQLLEFMKIIIGESWTTRTEFTSPTRRIKKEQTFKLGGRTVRVLPYTFGHTPGDLIVVDEKTGTLFAGDLVFYERAPTIPHADVAVWLSQLDNIATMKWERLVPGHGPLVEDPVQLGQMRDYLEWLRQSAREAVQAGDTLAEAISQPIPDEFQDMTTVAEEFQRSMQSLFRAHEAVQLDAEIPAY